MLIDSHAHLTSDALVPHLEEMLSRAHKVEAIINICTDQKSLRAGLQLSQKYPQVFNAAATTPHDVDAEGEIFFPDVAAAAQAGKLVAIGETGLDYHYAHSDPKRQKEFLLRYFALAKSVKLPLIFHCRDAFADLFALADAHCPSHPSILHCFTGTLEEAKGVLQRGWLISFSGIVTFKKSEALREVAKYVPLDQMVLETDAPYLAPQSHRGALNEPAFLLETAQLIATLKNLPLEKVAESTTKNAKRFFHLS